MLSKTSPSKEPASGVIDLAVASLFRASTASGPAISLADGLAAIRTDRRLNEQQIKVLEGDAARFAKIVDIPVHMIPLQPSALRPIVNAVLPTAHRIGRKRWLNIKSSIVKIARLAGVHAERAASQTVVIDPAWTALTDAIPGRLPRNKFRALARYCTRMNIAPAAVDEATLSAYQAWLEQDTLLAAPHIAVSSIRQIWNRSAGQIPGWPNRKLVAKRNPRTFRLTPDELPASFNDEVTHFLDVLRNPPLEGRIRPRKLKDATAGEYRARIYRAAASLVRKGRDPLSIRGLADIAHPDAMLVIDREMRSRHDKISLNVPATFSVLIVIARDFLGIDSQVVGRMIRLREASKADVPRRDGLSIKNRERVAQFDQPGLKEAFFQLPTRLFAAADRLIDEAPIRAANLFEKALGLAILQNKPLRISSLCALNLQTHFILDRNGLPSRIVIPESQTKNNVVIDFTIDDVVRDGLIRFLKIYRPLLQPGQSPYLFAGKKDGHKGRDAMGLGIKKLVEAQLGAAFNPHLIRHLVATLLYDVAPEGDVVVQRVLGLTSVKHAARLYGSRRGRKAQEFYASSIAEARTRLAVPGRRRPAGREV